MTLVWLYGFSSWLYVIAWLYNSGTLLSFFCMVIHFFCVVMSFCVVIQLSRGYMILCRGYLVHLSVYMVFHGYMTFPWLYGSFALLNVFSSWLYVIAWLYNSGTLVSFFCMVIHFVCVVISFCVVIQLSRGYMVLCRGDLVHLSVYMVFSGYMTFI